MNHINNIKLAIESLLRVKSYALTVVLSLGITLGALVAMFNLNYQLLAAPFPYPDADRLFVFKAERFDKGELLKGRNAPYPAWVDAYQKPSDKLEQLAIINYTDSVERRLPDSPVLTTANVTPEFLTMLNAPMALGRHFSKDEGLNAMTPVAIISHNTWRRIFNEDPAVLGKTLNIMEIEFKIIGVLSPDFVEPELQAPGLHTDLWLPFDYNDFPEVYRKDWTTNFGATFMLAKLKDGASKLEVEYEFSSHAASVFKAEAKVDVLTEGSVGFRLLSLKEVILRDASKQSLLMLAGVLLLLLIASTNVINLILARAANQGRTMAIQAALGAQHKHIFWEVFSEILVLMLAASILSIFIAAGLLDALKIAAQSFLPRLEELHLSLPTILFAAVVAVILALAFAALVSRQINYRALNRLLQSSGKGTGLQVSTRARQLLILSQVTLAGILLAASLHLLIQSFGEIYRPLGYSTANQSQVEISVATLWPSTSHEERQNFFLTLQQDLMARSDVEDVGISTGSPVGYGRAIDQLLNTEFGGDNKITMSPIFCDGSFLNILSIPLIAGRYFTNTEAREDARVAVVNESLARRLQADGQVLGKVVYRNGDQNPQGVKIIGVVKDLQLPAQTEPLRFYQASVPHHPEILIKQKEGKNFTAQEINKLAAKVHPQLKVFDIRTTARAIDILTSNQQTTARITAALTLLAFSLAAIGIYGVLSYSVQLRRFELGTRMAIGARPQMIFLQILKDNLLPVVVGLFIAFVVLIALWLWVQRTQYNLHTTGLGWLLPPTLILLLTAATSLLSVWHIIHKPASHILRGD
ncbi:hypothetical protein GCM10011613_20210 [Cellvibrio zantedeschiae]|uniref:ABC transporter permease n=1 Tax=Cellvibrio zantedeschiae TaxID=1237077 RepID=A0ABQ3B5F4_9GAMM|nr:ABC transporter permease [Cellvibrio zantedeschiae]GGY74705.1 hypothetical protein GCM10011613_20210 [Cellvibrio zantedeschiae]